MNAAIQALETKSPLTWGELYDSMGVTHGDEKAFSIICDSVHNGHIEIKYDGRLMLPVPESEREENPIVAILKKESPLTREEAARRMGLSPNSARFNTIVNMALYSTEPVHEDEYKRLCTVTPIPESERSTPWEMEGVKALSRGRELGVVAQDNDGVLAFTDLKDSGLLSDRELRAAEDYMREVNDYECVESGA